MQSEYSLRARPCDTLRSLTKRFQVRPGSSRELPVKFYFPNQLETPFALVLTILACAPQVPHLSPH